MLAGFCCTRTPPLVRKTKRKERIDPRPWERVVQSFARQLQVPVKPPAHCILGLDDKGVVAFVHFSMHDAPEFIHLDAIAVRADHRGRGGLLADRAFDEFFNLALGFLPEHGTTSIDAWIHERNEPSRSLAKRRGFAQGFDTMTNPRVPGLHHQWVLDITVG